VPNILPNNLLLHSSWYIVANIQGYKPNLTRKKLPLEFWRLQNPPFSFWVLFPIFRGELLVLGRIKLTYPMHEPPRPLGIVNGTNLAKRSKIQTKNQRMKIQLSCFSKDYDKQEIIKSFTWVENLIWNLKYQLLYQPEKWMLDDTTWSWICLFDAWIFFPERLGEGRFLGAVSPSSLTWLAWFKLLNLNLLDLTCLTW